MSEGGSNGEKTPIKKETNRTEDPRADALQRLMQLLH